MADYDTLIDAQTWAFIRKTNDSYPEDAVGLSIEGQRAVYDTMCRAFHQAYPDGVSATDRQANGVPVRIYSAGKPGTNVVYFHGGGFVVGGLESHDDVCAEICAQTGYRVISVDYRLAPEHKHPASFDDSATATQWVLEQYDGAVVLAGDSAGGNLAAAVAHANRGNARIKGQVLIYPDLGGDWNKGSYLEHANAPMLSRDEILFYRDIRLDGPEPVGDSSYAPLHDRDFSGLPPTVVFTAQCDPLCDDGSAYVSALRQAGGQALWINETGLVHGYLRARAMVARAQASFERIVLAIESLGQGIFPDDL